MFLRDHCSWGSHRFRMGLKLCHLLSTLEGGDRNRENNDEKESTPLLGVRLCTTLAQLISEHCHQRPNGRRERNPPKSDFSGFFTFGKRSQIGLRSCYSTKGKRYADVTSHFPRPAITREYSFPLVVTPVPFNSSGCDVPSNGRGRGRDVTSTLRWN
jgi:hypothetical protein